VQAEDPCLTDDTVLDFVAGRLAEAARADVERHLSHCLLCGRLVAIAAGYNNNVQPAQPANDLRNVHEALTDRGATRPITGEEYEPAPALLGTVLRETHRLERLVGRGGMGEVYEASHARLPGRFAVKVLHPHCVADPKAIVRFRREAEITSDLRHPNIVSIVDFDYTPAGAPYLVMEYLDGDELAHVITHEAPLALERVLRIVDQIASALTAVHRRGIVHRDLKPQNIFLVSGGGSDEEHVKLCDFGISKVRAASVALTGERVLLGTPQYMSPEQARGTGEVDARADQFALAAIVYEMLTGRLAFPGERVEVVVYRITHEEPAPLGPPWSEALATTLARAMQKDPARRFDSVADFAAALRAAAAGETALAAVLPLKATPGGGARTTMRHLPQTPPERGASTTLPAAAVTGSRRAVAGGIGTLLVLALGVAAFTLSRARSGDPAPAAASQPAPRAPAAEVAPPPPPPPPAPEVAPKTIVVKHAPPKSAPAPKNEPASEAAPAPPAEAPNEPGLEDAESATKRGSLIDRL
jgi:serine/threonine-protein kinase